MTKYTIEEGLVRPAISPSAGISANVPDIYAQDHCRSLCAYLRQELGGETCEVYRNAVLLPLRSDRVISIVDSLPMVYIFDDLDLGARSTPSRLYHALDESDDALGIIPCAGGRALWFHR